MSTTTDADRSAGQTPTLHLARWTVTSGSNANSRGAVDKALAEVLAGHPRLVGFVVRSLGEGPGAEGLVTVTILPPAGAEGARGEGEYSGASKNTNIIAASIEAYIKAINLLLAEEHWLGATESAGNRKRARVEVQDAKARRAQIDEEAGRIDTTEWFNQ